MGTLPFPDVKRPERGVHQPSPSSAEVATGRPILPSSLHARLGVSWADLSLYCNFYAMSSFLEIF